MSLYLQFADLLDYPDQNLPRRVGECIRELDAILPAAARCLESFYRSQEELGISRLQEAYTTAFDLQAECTLNLSYHLFGEDQRRGMFLAKLKEFYREAGIETSNELPDHVCYLLRYAAARKGSEESNAILADCLVPAISKISQGMEDKSSPYEALLVALLLYLEHDSARESVSRGAEIHSSRISISAG